jgi:radical SAM protein with 4Fe4S-binding SPASM domain
MAGKRRSHELTLAECLRVADELAELGCKHVTLIGGEPTLYPDWHKVGQHLSERGVLVDLISNGFSWSQDHVEQAKAAGFGAVSFSVDGLEKEHDSFRAPGSFERVVRAIDMTVAAGMRTAVNTTVHRLNQGSLAQMRRFLMDRGVIGWQLQLANPTGNMDRHRALLVAPEDLLWLVPHIAELCRIPCPSFEIWAGHNIGYFGNPEPTLRGADKALPFWLGCRAGCQILGIESGGDVKGCLSLPSSVHGEGRFVEGNVRHTSLRDIWNRADAFAYNRRFDGNQLGGFCRVCRFRDICRGGCRWSAFVQGDRGNENCFYFQAVKHGRTDVLAEVPTAEEAAFFGTDAGANAKAAEGT